jgi:hypothetical protein
MEHKLEVCVEERYELSQARALSITRTPESRFLRDQPQRLPVKAGIARSPCGHGDSKRSRPAALRFAASPLRS